MNEMNLKRNDFDPQPTVIGRIRSAWTIEENNLDACHIEILTSADDLVNLIQVMRDSKNQKRPIVLVGYPGTFKCLGFDNPEDLIGKVCLVYSDRKLEHIAVEVPGVDAKHWPKVLTNEYPDHFNRVINVGTLMEPN